jgi:hypothetical protein
MQDVVLLTRSGTDVTPYSHPDTIIPFEIIASNQITSNVAWRGMLILTGAVQDQRPLLLTPGETATYRGSFDLTNDTGLQTIYVSLVDSDGTLRDTQTLVIPTAPRYAPAVQLVDVQAHALGANANITVTLRNAGVAGDAYFTIVAFEQITEQRVMVPATSEYIATCVIPIPDGLLAGKYPISVQLHNQEIQAELVLEGADVALHHVFDADVYSAFSNATWTVSVEGTRGGPASYDVFMRYRGEEYTKTIRVGVGDVVSTTWQFDVGNTSDRASVLLTNHPEHEAQPRYTVVVDSQWIQVVHDDQTYLVSDKQRYNAGETAHLTLHINKPVQTAMVILPNAMPATHGLILWSSDQITGTRAVTGTFDIPLVLPRIIPTGRYFIRYRYDGNEGTVPIDVFGATVETKELSVQIDTPQVANLAAAMPVQADDTVTLSAGTPIVIMATIRSDTPLTNTIVMAYVLAPDGTALSLGDVTTIKQDLPVGVTPITLTGILQTTQPGTHQIVVRVLDEATAVVLGGDALFVDVGNASISRIMTDKGVYVPGETATGTVSIHGAGRAHITVTTSDGTVLVDEDVVADGFIEVSFIPPTAHQSDEVIIATITNSDGLQSSQQVAYKVATMFDVTPPVVQLVSPPSGTRISLVNENDTHITLTGVVTDDVAVKSVFVNGSEATVRDTQFTIPVTITQGVNLYHVMARDNANNVGVSSLHTLIGEPLFGITLSITPTLVRVGDTVNITAQLTTTDALSTTVKFPFSKSVFRSAQDTPSPSLLSYDGFVFDDGVQWNGFVSSASPLSITWQGVASQVFTETNVFAIMESNEMLPRKSNDVQVAIGASAAAIYLPIVMR